MTHRSKTGDERTKAQHQKRASQKRRDGPKTHPHSSSIASLETRVAQLTQELKEALQQQTATSDILRVIASSPGDVAPVLGRLTETACRLCKSYDAIVLLREGDSLPNSPPTMGRFLFLPAADGRSAVNGLPGAPSSTARPCMSTTSPPRKTNIRLPSRIRQARRKAVRPA